MDLEETKATIKQGIARITGIAPEQIGDTSSYRTDLGLDSLSLLELIVDLEYAFKIKVPEERLPELLTVQDTARIVDEFRTMPQA